jgi:hypothetical protein
LVARTLILLNGLSERLVPGRRLVQASLIQHLAAGAAAAYGTPQAGPEGRPVEAPGSVRVREAS